MVRNLRERIKKRDQLNQRRDFLLRVLSLKEKSLKKLTILLRDLIDPIKMKIEFQDHLIIIIMLDQALKGDQLTSKILKLDFRDKVTRGLITNSLLIHSNLRGCQEELKLLDLADHLPKDHNTNSNK